MKSVELRELPDEELLSQLEGLKEDLFNLRFQMATGQLDNPMRIKQARHDAARVLTVLRERHLEAELESEVAAADRKSLEERRAAMASGVPWSSPLAIAARRSSSDLRSAAATSASSSSSRCRSRSTVRTRAAS